jgi:ABC-2 type transport system permease protein
MKESSINFQTILASTIFVAFIWLLLMGMGIMKNGEMFSGRIWYAVLNTLAFTIISIAIAMLIASFNVSEDALSFISVVLGLGMSFLCGMFVPLELLDSKVIAIGRFLPLYWYIRANNMICGSGNELFNLSKVMKFMGVELLFAVAIFAFAFAVRKQKKAL